MLEDMPRQIDRLGSVKECEAMIHFLDSNIRQLRELKRRAHDKVKPLQDLERSQTLRGRKAAFPNTQGVGA